MLCMLCMRLCHQDLDVQGPVMEVLGAVRAAEAALQQQDAENASLKDR